MQGIDYLGMTYLSRLSLMSSLISGIYERQANLKDPSWCLPPCSHLETATFWVSLGFVFCF